MKLGYPCINRRMGCTANSTFRLASYSEEKLVEKVSANLDCLERTLAFNVRHRLLFFRIGSSLVPFASHPVCRFDWAAYFNDRFAGIGAYIRRHGLRISMHPDQFNVLSAQDPAIVERSVRELAYHCRLLDALNLDATAKVQIHLGGAYGDKRQALERFVGTHASLDASLRARLVVENDERTYDLRDCLAVHEKAGVPIVFDTFHHECLNRGEPVPEGLALAAQTWSRRDGVPMLDYSTQAPGKRRGSHAESVSPAEFVAFVRATRDLDFDIMLEVKDKEDSALVCARILEHEGRL